jgi:REP element-mobilizing transposase RayT
MSLKNISPFEAGFYYHVFNRAVGNELLFFLKKNYYYFLKKYLDIISEFVETYAYSLIPNHFHLLIKIPDNSIYPEKIITEKFRRLFISYSQSINKQEDRRGGLFMRPFKRKRIISEDQLSALIYYIHYNAVHHGIVKNPEDYPWSSYLSIIGNHETHLEREKVLEWFGGKEQFINSHLFQRDLYVGIKDLIIE